MAAVREIWQPPHSIDAERGVLGALLYEPQTWARISGKVQAEDFYRTEHAVLFETIALRAARGESADPVSIAAALDRAGELGRCGGIDYLVELVEQAPTGREAEAHANIVRDRANLRRLHDAGHRIVRLVRNPDGRSAADLLADATAILQALAGKGRVGAGLVDARTLVEAFVDDLERRRDGHRGMSVGLPDFDRLTCGLEPGDLVVLAGRPGMGKTALLVSIAAHVSKSAGVAVFSAEMPSSQLMRRCVSLLGSVSQSDLREAAKLTDEDWDRIGDAVVALASRRLWIDDTTAPALSHIRAETAALAAREELGMVLVDYAQLVKGEGANRYEQLRDVAYGLKDLAKDVGVPVIALAQINRGVEQRDNNRPRMSDLRDSGAIEEAADIIGLLYCEGYYSPDFPMPYVLECEIGKNRNGERGFCLWHFAGQYSRVGRLGSGAAARDRHYIASQRARGEDDDP